jgi:hypothetical protein
MKSSRSCYRIQFFSPTLAPPVSPMRFLVCCASFRISLLCKRPPESPKWFLVCSVWFQSHKSTSVSHVVAGSFLLHQSLFNLMRVFLLCDLVVGLFICLSLLHLHPLLVLCMICKVGLFFRFSLLLVASIVCSASDRMVGLFSLFPSPCCIFVFTANSLVVSPVHVEYM